MKSKFGNQGDKPRKNNDDDSNEEDEVEDMIAE